MPEGKKMMELKGELDKSTTTVVNSTLFSQWFIEQLNRKSVIIWKTHIIPSTDLSWDIYSTLLSTKWFFSFIFWAKKKIGINFVLFFFLFLFGAFCFFWLYLQYTEVPRLKSNRSCSCWLMPQPQQCWVQTASLTYTTAQGNARSLTYQARPGIEPASSWILVRFINHRAMTELPKIS